MKGVPRDLQEYFGNPVPYARKGPGQIEIKLPANTQLQGIASTKYKLSRSRDSFDDESTKPTVVLSIAISFKQDMLRKYPESFDEKHCVNLRLINVDSKR